MSVSIKYKGNEIASINGGGTKTLKTEGKYCEGDIEVKETATTGMSVEQKSWRSTGGGFQGYTLYARSKALTEPASLAAGAQVEMKISGSALGNASRASVLKGRTFTSLNALPATSGTMPNNGAKTLEITDADTAVTIPEGYYNGSGSAKIADAEKAKLTEENIREGVTILGKTGTLKVANLQTEKSVSVTANGTVEVTPDEGYDGMKKVSVAVDVPTGGGEPGETANVDIEGVSGGNITVTFEMLDGTTGGVLVGSNASVNIETKVGSVVVATSSNAMHIDGDASNGIEVLPTNYDNQPVAAGESSNVAAAKITDADATVVFGR